MKIFYLNDRKDDARIFFNTLHNEDCLGILRPAQGEWFEIPNAPSENHSLFVKTWEHNMVLFGWLPENLP